MLTQLSRLSVEADGRYATASELQFLKDCFETVDDRISTYEKIRDAEADIIPRMEVEKRAYDASLFRLADRDVADLGDRLGGRSRRFRRFSTGGVCLDSFIDIGSA